MKLEELHEGIFDTLKRKLGDVKGKIVSSLTGLISAFKKNPNERLTTIETFQVHELNVQYEARVDTGALVCAIHAEEINVDTEKNQVSFKHNGAIHNMPLLRIKDVKNANGISSRPRVALTYTWGGKNYSNIETSLADRSKMNFTLLIGRNLIQALKMPVHINDKDIGTD